MARYSAPGFTPEEVNRAGRVLIAFYEDPLVDLGNAMEVIDNWRAAHAYPAQCMYVTLKRNASAVNPKSDVAQRIKRMPSIVDKLAREAQMKLSQMQDIGGCRAVVSNVAQVRLLERRLQSSRWLHEALAPKDYIEHPKASGYRGIHLKYRYVGEGNKKVYNGLKVEIQLRTRLQHMWATAVEAADTFTLQALKSSRGDPAWQRFFALMGSAFALKERSPLVPNTPGTVTELALEIRDLSERHHIAPMFSGYSEMMTRIEGEQNQAGYYLVALDPVARRSQIRVFSAREAALAQRAYTEAEKRVGTDSATQIVLVSTSSIRALKRVYPNYFLDTVAFEKRINEVLEIADFVRPRKAA